MAEKEEVSRIRLSREALEGVTSPLLRLRDKELELQGKLLEARKEAEILVAEARKNAVEVRRQAIEKAVSEAEKHYQEEIEKTKKEAEKIRGSIKEEIKQIEKIGETNLDKAIELIMKLVLPEQYPHPHLLPEGEGRKERGERGKNR